jgi:hypothetical protein
MIKDWGIHPFCILSQYFSTVTHEIAATYQIAGSQKKLKPVMSRVYPERK